MTYKEYRNIEYSISSYDVRIRSDGFVTSKCSNANQKWPDFSPRNEYNRDFLRLVDRVIAQREEIEQSEKRISNSKINRFKDLLE